MVCKVETSVKNLYSCKDLINNQKDENLWLKKFAIVALNINNEAFILYIAVLAESKTIFIYFSDQVQDVLLISKNTRISI